MKTYEKTNKEKMMLGEIYDANYDNELIKERQEAKDKCFKYNTTHPSNMEERKQVLKGLLGSIKGEFVIEPNFWCDYGYNIAIGENFYSNHNLVILDGNKVTFGDNVFIGPNCSFYTAEHPLDKDMRNKGLETARPITVGDNVWIGGNTVVLPGVTIGSNTVIGAGSVVTKDIPNSVVAFGNPCKVQRKI